MDINDTLLHPYDVYSDMQEEIKRNLGDSYPNMHKIQIDRNLSNTRFIFDSTPDVTYEFFKDRTIPYYKRRVIEEEYEDYMSVRNNLMSKRDLNYYEILCTGFGIDPKKYQDHMQEILSLDIRSYSKASTEGLSELEKTYFLRRREAYKKECEELGIEPLTNTNVIELLINYDEKGKTEINEKLIDRTKFGKRIMRSLMERSGAYFNGYDISHLLFSGKNRASNIYNTGSRQVIVSHIPLVQNVLTADADLSFLHEIRKIAEVTDKGTGLELYKDKTYKTFNSMRLEHKAKEDERFYGIHHIFAVPRDGKELSEEELLLPLIADFLERNSSTIDSIAITSDVPKLETTFGYEARELGKGLNTLSRGLTEFGMQPDTIKSGVIREKVLKMEQCKRTTKGFDLEEK